MKSAVIQSANESGLFRRLPVTFSAYFLDQVKSWELLFPAERTYYERLVALLQRSERAAVDAMFAPLREVERRMSLPPDLVKGEFSLDHVDFLNRSPFYADWRQAVAAVFSRLDPVLEQEVARAGKPRLMLVLTPAEIPLAPERMWTRVAQHGKRITVTPPDEPAEYAKAAAALLARVSEARPAYAAWGIEAAEEWSALPRGSAVYLSYAGLQSYRTRLMGEIDRIVNTEQIRGPRQLGARLRALRMHGAGGAAVEDELLADFTRAVLLNGNGTLLINNTFVEWSTVQAIRRARPSLLAVSFGIRNKMKPFSSLLIFTDQEKANPIPSQMDTLGTSVDLEVLYQYLWQECEKYAEYRNNTAYLFVAPGAEQMLCIAPRDFPLLAEKEAVRLSSLMEHAAAWLGV